MRTKFTFVLLWILAFASNGLAEDAVGTFGGSFLTAGVSARALGMGGAFTAIADDPSAIVWNPGATAQLRHTHAQFMYSGQSLDRAYNFLAICQGLPWGKDAGSLGTVHIGVINYTVGDIPSYDVAGNYLGTFNDSENAYLIGYSFGFLPRRSSEKAQGDIRTAGGSDGFDNTVFIGGNYKYYYTSLAGYHSKGSGFDAGALYKVVPKYLSVGFTAQELGAKAKWDTESGRTDPFQTIYRFGVKTETPVIPVTLDLDLVYPKDSPMELNYGAEYWHHINEQWKVALRTGISDTFFNVGASAKVAIPWTDLEVDYSYSIDPIGAGNTNRVNLGIEIPSSKPIAFIPPPPPPPPPQPPTPPVTPEKQSPEEKMQPSPKYPGGTCVVAPGDNLTKLAIRFYHSPDSYLMWKHIFRANKGKIKNPNVIYDGQTILIPPEP